MAMPRSKYVRDGEEGVYHCYSRCVRRAFLCGFDPVTGRDFSHRKTLIVHRLHFLASIFAVDVCAYSVMDTHLHNVLRLRPDIAAAWSDLEVATRWITLSPKKKKIPLDVQISALRDCPQRIAVLRRRLSSLSWFMKQLNEYIARAANKEDKVKGHFWESRFKCQALLDDAAIVAGMVYVDLNVIRAGQAPTPEDSDFTSIQERIRNWRKEVMAHSSLPANAPQNLNSDSSDKPARNGDDETFTPSISHNFSITEPPADTSTDWLCPIQSALQRRGILQMPETDYFDLVDRTGRILRADKRGAIDPSLSPILLRIGANPQKWLDTVANFDSKFRLVAGRLASLRAFAQLLGKQWFIGVASARTAFSTQQI